MAIKWMENWLDCLTQKVGISSIKSIWWQVTTSDVPLGPILEPTLFNAFINNWNLWMIPNCRDVIDMLEGRAHI